MEFSLKCSKEAVVATVQPCFSEPVNPQKALTGTNLIGNI